MKPYKRALWWTTALTLGMLAACDSPKSGSSNSGAKAAPEFTLPALDGSKFTLASQRGQVVILDFWATWCGPCQESIPVFERLSVKYKGKGMIVVGVNVDGGPDDVPAFVKKLKMTYPIVLDNDYDVMRQYKVRGIPNLFLLDKKGNIRKHWVGIDDDLEKTVESEVENLLKES